MRNFVCVLLLLTAGVDIGSPWIASVIANNETCSCCHRKGAACCRRMRHGSGWQDRSECGANCCGAHGTNFAAAPWAPVANAQFTLLPSSILASRAPQDFKAAVAEFSLRQRPPPFPLS